MVSLFACLFVWLLVRYFSDWFVWLLGLLVCFACGVCLLSFLLWLGRQVGMCVALIVCLFGWLVG